MVTQLQVSLVVLVAEIDSVVVPVVSPALNDQRVELRRRAGPGASAGDVGAAAVEAAEIAGQAGDHVTVPSVSSPSNPVSVAPSVTALPSFTVAEVEPPRTGASAVGLTVSV